MSIAKQFFLCVSLMIFLPVCSCSTKQTNTVKAADYLEAAPAVRQSPVKGGPKIEPSNVLEELFNKKKSDPKISAQELADLGNELIQRKGYNYAFNTCEIAEANKSYDDNTDELRPFTYSLKDLKGKKITFQIMAGSFGHPCGCAFDIPLLKISKDKMTVIADGTPIELIRPRDFILDEIELVDNTLKKTIRTWYNHFDMVPLGISKDGTKIYVDTGYGLDMLDELVVEINESGTSRLIPANDENIIKDKEEIKNFPPDKNNAYLGYLRFKTKEKSYVIKFSYPCT